MTHAWPKSCYEVERESGLIKRRAEAPISTYEPFDFYKPHSRTSPHRQFAELNLDRSTQRKARILGFVNQWGLLGLWDYTGFLLYGSIGVRESESLENFRTEQCIFLSIVTITSALRSRKTEKVIRALNLFSKSHWKVLKPTIVDPEKNLGEYSHVDLLLQETTALPPRQWPILKGPVPEGNELLIGESLLKQWPLFETQWKAGRIPADTDQEVVYWVAGCVLHTLMKRGLAGVELSTAFHGPVQTYWQFPSLLSVLYQMYWFDLESIKSWQICQHKPCGQYIISDKPRKYCQGTNCARAAAQARYERGETKPRKKG